MNVVAGDFQIKMRFLVLAAFIGLSSGCASKTEEKPFGFIQNEIPVGPFNGIKIIGGNDTAPGEYPWQVSIQTSSWGGDFTHNCGGIIYDETHIISAAHCVQGYQINQINVVAGASNVKDIDEPTQQRWYPKRMIYHPEFKRDTLVYDVSVITLPGNLTFNKFVQPLRLPPRGHTSSGLCVNTGWGNAHPEGGSPIIIPDALQAVELEVVPYEDCDSIYKSMIPLHPSMMCAAGEQWQGACNGDSGGPLICFDHPDETEEPYLSGIVSWGMNPCGQEMYPSVYAAAAYEENYDFLLTECNRP